MQFHLSTKCMLTVVFSISSGFYDKDQQKVIHNYEVEGLFIIYYEKCDVHSAHHTQYFVEPTCTAITGYWNVSARFALSIFLLIH